MKNEEPNQIKCYCGHTTMCDCSPIEPKQEALEEVAEKLYPHHKGITTTASNRIMQRMYSDMQEAFGLIYVLETLLDFAGEDKATNISFSTTDAVKIIKLLKQI